MDDKPYTLTVTLDHLERWKAIADLRLELLEEVLKWHRNYWDFEQLNSLINKINTEVAKSEELGDD